MAPRGYVHTTNQYPLHAPWGRGCHKLKFEKLYILSVEVIAGPLKVVSQLQSILQLGTTKFLSQRAPVTSEAEHSVGRDEKWERGTAEAARANCTIAYPPASEGRGGTRTLSLGFADSS